MSTEALRQYRRARQLRPGVIARYAVGELVTSGFAALPGLVLVFYLTDTLAVPALLAGLVVTVAKFWDIVIDVLIGSLSDRDFARQGSRRRLMRIAALVLPVFFIATFAVPAGTEPALAALWVFVAFVLAATGFSLFQVPYNALPVDLVSSYDARTRLISARILVLTVAILLFGGGGPALRDVGVDLFRSDHGGYLFMAIGASALFVVAILVSSTVERAARGKAVAAPAPVAASLAFTEIAPPRDSIAMRARRGVSLLKTSAPFRTLLGTFFVQALAAGGMLAGAQYIATWVLGDTDAVTILFIGLFLPAFLAAPAWKFVAGRIGKERSYVIATSIFFVAALTLVGVLIVPGLWILVPLGFIGIAYSGIQALPLSMLPDVIAHDARTNGPGRGGLFSGMWTAGETTGLAFGTSILAVILATSGYLESTAATPIEAQPTSAVFGIVMSFSIVPATLMALSFIPLLRYPLRKKDVDLPAPQPVSAMPPPSAG